MSPDKNQRSHDQLLALIAHELQHALEVIEHEDVVDGATMQAMFRKIGVSVKGGYETAAAAAIGDRVLSEVTTERIRSVSRPSRP